MRQIGLGVVLLMAGTVLVGEAQAQCTGPVIESGQVEMNTVAIDKLVKTIEVEKFVFDCDVRPDTTIPQRIRDVQIFAEILELAKDDTFVPRGKQFEAIVCDKKTSPVLVVDCRRSPVPPLPSGVVVRVEGCRHVPGPIAMDTVSAGKLVKTVKAQKEVFLCPAPTAVGGPSIVAVTTFTEIIEKPSKEGFGPAQKGFEVAICVIDVGRGEVQGCRIDAAPRPLP